VKVVESRAILQLALEPREKITKWSDSVVSEWMVTVAPHDLSSLPYLYAVVDLRNLLSTGFS